MKNNKQKIKSAPSPSCQTSMTLAQIKYLIVFFGACRHSNNMFSAGTGTDNIMDDKLSFTKESGLLGGVMRVLCELAV